MREGENINGSFQFSWYYITVFQKAIVHVSVCAKQPEKMDFCCNFNHCVIAYPTIRPVVLVVAVALAAGGQAKCHFLVFLFFRSAIYLF